MKRKLKIGDKSKNLALSDQNEKKIQTFGF